MSALEKGIFIKIMVENKKKLVISVKFLS